MTTSGILRIKRVIAEQGRAISILLVGVAVLSLAGAGWLAANPITTDSVVQRHSQTVESNVSTSAVVVEESELWESRQRLEDKPVYLLSSTPHLILTPSVDVPPGTERTTQRLTLVYRATRDDRTFWRSERVLVNDTAVEPGGTVESTAVVNVSSVRERVRELRSETAGAGSISVALRHDVVYETDRYAGTLNATAPLAFGGGAYAIGEGLSAGRTHTTPIVTTAPAPYNDDLVEALGLVGVASALGTVVVRRLARTLPEPDVIERKLTRARYSEWISEGNLMLAGASQHIPMDSLDDLVDLGIDSKRRVIHDPDRSRFVVIVDDVLYYYEVDGASRPSRELRGDTANGARGDFEFVPDATPIDNGDGTDGESDEKWQSFSS